MIIFFILDCNARPLASVSHFRRMGVTVRHCGVCAALHKLPSVQCPCPFYYPASSSTRRTGRRAGTDGTDANTAAQSDISRTLPSVIKGGGDVNQHSKHIVLPREHRAGSSLPYDVAGIFFVSTFY